jgi:hypothetical protein
LFEPARVVHVSLEPEAHAAVESSQQFRVMEPSPRERLHETGRVVVKNDRAREGYFDELAVGGQVEEQIEL